MPSGRLGPVSATIRSSQLGRCLLGGPGHRCPLNVRLLGYELGERAGALRGRFPGGEEHLDQRRLEEAGDADHAASGDVEHDDA